MLSTTGQRRVVVVTVLLGLLGAIAVAVGAPADERTFAVINGPAQSLMSVTVAFLGVLLVSDLHRPVRLATVLSTLRAGLVLAMLVAAFGVVISATVTAVVPAQPVGGRWEDAGAIALGSLLVQGVALLLGTGLGLLLRRPLIACLATITPLGLWLLLGAIDALRPAQSWLTPFPSVQHLLSGDMNPTTWAQWLVVLVLYGLVPNALGSFQASRVKV